MAVAQVNVWTGSFVTPASTTTTPRAATQGIPITVANTAGNWMIAVISWLDLAGYPAPTFVVADNVHNWWEPAAAPGSVSSASGSTRCAIWMAPACEAATTVQVSPSGFTTGWTVVIYEFSGLLPWVKAAAATNFANAAAALTVSLGAPSASALVVAGIAGDDVAHVPVLTGGGWSSVTSLTATGASNILGAAAWQVTSGSTTATWTPAAGTQDLAGVSASFVVAATAPAQPSPAWPATILEMAPNAGFGTAPDSLTWVTATPRYLSLSATQGRQYELAALTAGEGVLMLDNPDGALLPPGTGSFGGISSGCPVRLRCAWQGGSWQAQFHGTGAVASPGITKAWTFTTSGTPIAFNFFIVTTSQSLNISVGDAFKDTSNAGTVFTVTSKSVPFAGFVNVTYTPVAGVKMSNPDVVTYLGIPVTANVQYSFAAWLGCSVTYASGVQAKIAWSDSTGAAISTTSSASATSVTATAVVATGPAPGNAAYATLLIAAAGTPAATVIFSASATPAVAGYLTPGTGYTGWVIQNSATITTALGWQPDPNGPPNVSPWWVPFSGYLERLPQSWDENLRGRVQSAIVDAWAGVNFVPNPILYTEILNDNPWAYWPCSDPAGSKIASNFTAGNRLPLTLTQSKFSLVGTGTSQTFGAATSTLFGAQGTLLLTPQGSFRSTAQAGMWQLSFNSINAQVQNYSLVAPGLAFPSSQGTLEFWFQTNSSMSGGSLPSSISKSGLLMLGENKNIAGPTTLSALYGLNVYLDLPSGGGFGGTGEIFLAQNSHNTGTQVSPGSTDYWKSGTPVTHVAVTWSGSNWQAYVNGAATTSGTFGGTTPSHLPYLTVNGSSGYPYGLTDLGCFPGVMAHVALYTKQLTQARIMTHYQAGVTGLVGEGSSTRIERLLQAGKATGRRMITQETGTNVDFVVSCQDIGGQPAAQSVNNLTANLVPGMFLVAPCGDMFQLSKQSTWNQPISWFLGENNFAGEISYNPDNVTFEFDPTRIVNQIQINQLDNQDTVVPSLTTQEAASQLAYGTVSYQVTGYLEGDLTVPLTFGPGLLDLADWLASQYAAPHLRLSSVTVDASSQPLGWNFVLGVSCGDMIQVSRRPIGSPAFTVIGRVSQTERSFSFGMGGTVQARVTLTIDPAPEYFCLTCDDPVRGILNGTNILGW